MDTDHILFFFLASLSVVTALLVVTKKNPIASAMSLVFNFFILAGIYLTLSAQFIAIIQILVYAGAIMVLFVFVIMLLNLEDDRKLKDSLTPSKFFKVLLSIVMIAIIIYIISYSAVTASAVKPAIEAYKIGTVEQIGYQLFTNFLLPFEITSILLLSAIIGAVVIAKKRFP